MSKKLTFKEIMEKMGPVDRALNAHFQKTGEVVYCDTCGTAITVVDRPEIGVVIASCDVGCSYSRTKYKPKKD